MARYSNQKLEKMRSDAIALYKSNPKLTSKEIAAALNLNVTTVCNYLKYVRPKPKGRRRI